MQSPSTSIGCLIGKRAVITRWRVEIVSDIKAGSAARVESVFNMLRLSRPDEPVSMVFDGWVRSEYGRPLDQWEIERALAASGIS